jgi:hypothetical protein
MIYSPYYLPVRRVKTRSFDAHFLLFVCLETPYVPAASDLVQREDTWLCDKVQR